MLALTIISEVGQRKSPNGYTAEYAINVPSLKALPLVKSHPLHPSNILTGQIPLPVKQIDPTSQIPLPDQSKDLTQTLLNPPKPKNRAPAARVKTLPRPDNVSPQVWDDFVEHRRKKGGLTKTALDRIAREAAKAGWTLEDALAKVVTRNWQAFEAEWVKGNGGASTMPADGSGLLQHMLSKETATNIADVRAPVPDSKEPR